MTVYAITIAAVLLCLLMASQAKVATKTKTGSTVALAPSAGIWYGIAGAILAMVAGLRWGVGTDFYTYVQLYSRYKTEVLESFRTFDEPGSKLLAWIASKIYDDPAMFFLLASLITVGLTLWCYRKHSIAVAMSFALFIFVGVWHGSFNGVRQFLAAAIILAAHRLAVDRKPLKYALAVLLAASFHLSAVVMLLLYFLPNRKLKGGMIVVILGGAVAALYATDAVLEVIQLVTDDPDLGLNAYAQREVNPLRVAVSAAPMLFYWTRGASTEDDGDWFYRNMAVVHFGFMLAGSASAYITRFGIYPLVFLPLVVPRMVDFPDRRMTSLVRIAAVVLYAVFWYTDVAGSSSLNNFTFVFGRTD